MSIGDPRVLPLTLPKLRFQCSTDDTPIVLHLGPDVMPRPISDREALRLLNELSRAIYVRIHKKWST